MLSFRLCAQSGTMGSPASLSGFYSISIYFSGKYFKHILKQQVSIQFFAIKSRSGIISSITFWKGTTTDRNEILQSPYLLAIDGNNRRFPGESASEARRGKASEKIDPDGQGPEAQNRNQNKQDLKEQERVRPRVLYRGVV